ncbi:hypothetical protein [Ktedonospora formicarum]
MSNNDASVIARNRAAKGIAIGMGYLSFKSERSLNDITWLSLACAMPSTKDLSERIMTMLARFGIAYWLMV